MADTRPAPRLTHRGALKVLDAAMAEAARMGVAQCICVVDPAGHPMAFVRMDGANRQSFDSALRKAQSAAAKGVPSGALDSPNGLKIAIATNGKRTDMNGALPLIVDGHVVGAIGIGTGTDEEDVAVAGAGVKALAS
ncbi:MAG: heme-binding protein [Rhodospirillales bacterium]